MNEHSFVKAIHGKVSSDIFSWKINDRFAGGVADAYYAGPADFVWVEYKYIPKFPVRDSTLIKPCVRPNQITWHKRMQALGHNSLLMVGCEKSVYMNHDPRTWSDLQLTKGEFQKQSVTFKDAIQWINQHCLAKSV